MIKKREMSKLKYGESHLEYMVMKTPDERAMEMPRKRVKREFRFLLITFKLARQYGLWGFGYDYKC